MPKRIFGLTLPIERGALGYFNATTEVAQQLRANLTNLLLTKKGERMLQPTFGCNLHSIVFEAQTDDGLATVKASIKDAVSEWMPFINVDEVDVTRSEDYNQVFVRISFRLLTNQNITDSIVLVF
jgi:uncharacterized protein